MTDKDQNAKPKRALGQDPFADLEGFDLENIEANDEPTATTPTPSSEEQTLEESTLDESAALTAAAEAALEAVQPEAEPVGASAKPERQPETAIESERQPEMAIESDEKTNHLLDDIIATIDNEMERVFESEVAGDVVEIAAGHRERQEQYIIFTLAGAQYAVPAANVREVSEILTLTPVPYTPAWLLGVTNLRGDILSVVDLNALLGTGREDEAEPVLSAEALLSSEREMLIVHPRHDEALVTTGLVVDAVTDIRYLAVEHIETPALSQQDQLAPYLHGIYEDEGDLLVVLNLERLLLSPQMQQFEPI